MGCDGGSIPMREDMVRVKKTAGPPSTQEKLNDLAIRWSTCSLSAEPLRVPIVADMLGNLFNKEALLAAALSKSLPEAFSHIRSLKRDTIELRFAVNPAHTGEGDASRWICPVTLKEINGRQKFIVLRGCGCVVAASALVNVPDSSACLVCGAPYKPGTEIQLNPDKEEYVVLKAKLDDELRQQSKQKKAKKQAKKLGSADDTSTTSTSSSTSTSSTSTSSTNDAATSTTTTSDTAASSSSSSSSAPDTAETKPTKRKADTESTTAPSAKRAKRATSTTEAPAKGTATFLSNPNEVKKIDAKHQRYLQSAAYASLFASTSSST